MSENVAWAEDVLQGIAFWIGHQRCYYRHAEIPELVIVHELCNLMQAHCLPGEKVVMEVAYSKILEQPNDGLEKLGRGRADLIITSGRVDKEGNFDRQSVQSIIEVKRYKDTKACKNKIYEDMRRLNYCLNACIHGQRAFLIVVSEAKSPDEFVYEQTINKGKENQKTRIVGRKGNHEIPDSSGKYAVRRVCKALTSNAVIKSGHYACLIEVLSA